jgi:hypothetical protein
VEQNVDQSKMPAGSASQLRDRVKQVQYVRLDLHAFKSEQDVEQIHDCFASLRP